MQGGNTETVQIVGPQKPKGANSSTFITVWKQGHKLREVFYTLAMRVPYVYSFQLSVSVKHWPHFKIKTVFVSALIHTQKSNPPHTHAWMGPTDIKHPQRKWFAVMSKQRCYVVYELKRFVWVTVSLNVLRQGMYICFRHQLHLQMVTPFKIASPVLSGLRSRQHRTDKEKAGKVEMSDKNGNLVTKTKKEKNHVQAWNWLWLNMSLEWQYYCWTNLV